MTESKNFFPSSLQVSQCVGNLEKKKNNKKKGKNMTKISQSPLPAEIIAETKSPSGNKKEESKEELFDFPTAMKKVTEGQKISKKEWKNTAIYGEVKDERLILHKEDGKDYAWIISMGDLTGEDFIII